MPISAENRHASFQTIYLKIQKTTLIRHYSMFKKKICFQTIPAEYKIKYYSTDISAVLVKKYSLTPHTPLSAHKPTSNLPADRVHFLGILLGHRSARTEVVIEILIINVS